LREGEREEQVLPQTVDPGGHKDPTLPGEADTAAPGRAPAERGATAPAGRQERATPPARAPRETPPGTARVTTRGAGYGASPRPPRPDPGAARPARAPAGGDEGRPFRSLATPTALRGPGASRAPGTAQDRREPSLGAPPADAPPKEPESGDRAEPKLGTDGATDGEAGGGKNGEAGDKTGDKTGGETGDSGDERS